jgi:hypothetical protein
MAGRVMAEQRGGFPETPDGSGRALVDLASHQARFVDGVELLFGGGMFAR